MVVETAELSIRVRFLDKPELCSWCWDIIDRRDRAVEGSWENEWTLYDSPCAALTAGLAQLATRERHSGSRLSNSPAAAV